MHAGIILTTWNHGAMKLNEIAGKECSGVRTDAERTSGQQWRELLFCCTTRQLYSVVRKTATNVLFPTTDLASRTALHSWSTTTAMNYCNCDTSYSSFS